MRCEVAEKAEEEGSDGWKKATCVDQGSHRKKDDMGKRRTEKRSGTFAISDQPCQAIDPLNDVCTALRLLKAGRLGVRVAQGGSKDELTNRGRYQETHEPPAQPAAGESFRLASLADLI